MAQGKKAVGGQAGMKTVAAGWRHLRAEFGRWWRAEDQTDTHIAHRLLNEQYALWRRGRREFSEHARRNIQALKQQQQMQLQIQHRRMYQQKQQMRRGGGYGYGGYGGGGGSSMSPITVHRTMQWGDYQIKVDSEIFEHVPISPVRIKIGREQLAARRRRTASALLFAAVVAWVLLWWLAPAAGLVVTLAGLLLATAGAAVQGHRPMRRRPPVPQLRFIPSTADGDVDLDGDQAPFPIRDAGRSPREARESVRLALKAAKVAADVDVPTPMPWGWRVPLTLTSGTLPDLAAKLGDVRTTLRVGAKRLVAQAADEEDSAAVVLRVLTSNPIVRQEVTTGRRPRSCSIRDDVSLGRSIDGEDTPVSLLGQHVLIVANTGGGKSLMMRHLAEFVTACRDAVAVDIDPSGLGLGPLRSCAARGAYNPLDAERLLENLLGRAEARIASLADVDHDNVEVGENLPAIVAFIDEWARLTARGRQLALDLLGVGRKARVTVVMTTRNATKAALGEAIANALGIRIMLSCRAEDVPLVVARDDSRSDAIAQGWLPHQLVPSPGPEEPADAGQFYVIAPRHRHPILRYVPKLASAAAAELAAQRVEAGIPDIDAVPTAAATDALVEAAADLPPILRALRCAFAAAGDPQWLTMTQIADYLAGQDPARWGRWDGRPDRLTHVGKALRAELRKAGLEDIPRARLGADIDVERPTVYYLADIRAALPT